LSYYSSAVTINSEGDTSISEETLEGLGRTPRFLSSLFGVIMKIVPPPKPSRSYPQGAWQSSVAETEATPEYKLEYDARLVEATLEPKADEASSLAATDAFFSEDVATTQKPLFAQIFPHPGQYPRSTSFFHPDPAIFGILKLGFFTTFL
jgi:solute carrier family 25 phosphate transporter 23/24/25/41